MSWGLDIVEVGLSFGLFVGVFAVMATAEYLRPRRRLAEPKPRRWLTNLAIVGLDMLLVRVMAALSMPVAAVAAAAYARAMELAYCRGSAGRPGWDLD
jgi:hypothetical protein